jgi:hypothetical protein
MLLLAGLCDANGNLNSNIESFRMVGGDFRQTTNYGSQGTLAVASVRYDGGQTYQLLDANRAVKLKISDRNPLGFWKKETTGDLFDIEGAVDVVSFTIAVRYRQVSFPSS